MKILILLLIYIINNGYGSAEIVFTIDIHICSCSIACTSSAVVTTCDGVHDRGMSTYATDATYVDTALQKKL